MPLQIECAAWKAVLQDERLMQIMEFLYIVQSSAWCATEMFNTYPGNSTNRRKTVTLMQFQKYEEDVIGDLGRSGSLYNDL